MYGNKRADASRGGGRGGNQGGGRGGNQGGGRGGNQGGGRGGNQGGGRGGNQGGNRGGGQGPVGRKSAQDYSVVTNSVMIDVSKFKFQLWSILAKGPNETELVNPMNIKFNEGIEKFGPRILRKEIVSFLDEQFGVNCYTYDGAAIIMICENTKSSTETSKTITIGNRDPMDIELEMSPAKSKDCFHHHELELRYNHVVNQAFITDIEQNDGYIVKRATSSTIYPLKTSALGKKLNDLIDLSDKKNERDVHNLAPYEVRRGFEVSTHFYANKELKPPPNTLDGKTPDQIKSELARGAYKGVVNILIKTGCFFPKTLPMLEAIKDSPNNRAYKIPGQDQSVEARLRHKHVQDLLKGMYFKKNVNKYSEKAKAAIRDFDTLFIVEKVSDMNANEYKFTKDDKEVSVAQYMQQQYGMKLAYPNLPLIVCKERGHFSFVPAELLVLIPQAVSTFSNSLQNNFTNVSRIATDRFRTSVGHVVEHMQNKNSIANQVLSNWSITLVAPDMMLQNGYLAIDPAIMYKEGITPVANGRWNLRSSSMISNVPLKNKFILFIDLGTELTEAAKKKGEENTFQLFAQRMMQELSKLFGVPVNGSNVRPVSYSSLEKALGPNMRKLVKSTPKDLAKFHSEFTQILTQSVLKSIGSTNPDDISKKVSFAMILLPDARKYSSDYVDSVYALLKIFFNEGHNIATQCFLPDKTPIINRRDAHDGAISQHFASLIAGANIKSGFRNFDVKSDLLKQLANPSTMLLGVDLQHSSISEIGRVSTAGAVASTDANFSKYVAATAVQKFTNDIVSNMRAVIKKVIERRNADQKASGKMEPIKNIMYFRDGVDHGSEIDVLQKEAMIIEKVCMEIFNVKPAISVLVCLKRHNSRIFPMNIQKDGKGNPTNVPPGTILGVAPQNKPIASVGPSPSNPCFYLMGHEAIPGSTAVPLRVSVIKNASGLSPWDLAQLTYFIMHGDQVVTKSVSLPAPCLYAHKLCEHIKAVTDYKNRMVTQSKALEEISAEADEYSAKMVNLAFL